jgi:hypothetical protein
VAGDVSSDVSLHFGPLVRVRRGRRWRQTVTLTNTSGASIQGPLALVLESLSRRATLSSLSGLTRTYAPMGDPYAVIPVDGGVLDPGGSLTAVLAFVSPRKAISYAPRVLAGGTF